MFHDEIDKNQYLYHFTNYTTGLEYILPTNSIRFNPLINTNDPRETKEWMFSMSCPTDQPESNEFFELCQKFNQILKKNSKVLCLTRDNLTPPPIPNEIFGRGYSHTRMWAQYAGNHKGICLMFDKYKLEQLIDEQLSSKGNLYKGNVNYGTHSREVYESFNFDYDEVRKLGLENVAINHIKKYYEVLYFEKSLDWKEECEYRWVLLGAGSNYEYVEYKDSLVSIILGADFPQIYEMIIAEYCKKKKIHAARVFWNNGRPSILPVYIPETDESFINRVI